MCLFFSQKKKIFSCNLKTAIYPQLKTIPVLQPDFKSYKTLSQKGIPFICHMKPWWHVYLIWGMSNSSFYGLDVCKVVVAKFLSQNHEKRNMPRFFQHWNFFTKVKTLAASGGIFQIITLYVAHTKIFVWPSQIFLVFWVFIKFLVNKSKV